MTEEIIVKGSKGGSGNVKTDIFSLIRTHIHTPNAHTGSVVVSVDSFYPSIMSRVYLDGKK